MCSSVRILRWCCCALKPYFSFCYYPLETQTWGTLEQSWPYRATTKVGTTFAANHWASIPTNAGVVNHRVELGRRSNTEAVQSPWTVAENCSNGGVLHSMYVLYVDTVCKIKFWGPHEINNGTHQWKMRKISLPTPFTHQLIHNGVEFLEWLCSEMNMTVSFVYVDDVWKRRIRILLKTAATKLPQIQKESMSFLSDDSLPEWSPDPDLCMECQSNFTHLECLFDASSGS